MQAIVRQATPAARLVRALDRGRVGRDAGDPKPIEQASTSGVNQEAWRGSQTMLPSTRLLSSLRKLSATPGWKVKLGGSWTSSGPSLGPGRPPPTGTDRAGRLRL